MQPTSIRAIVHVLIADDHPIVRGGLRAMLNSDPSFALAAEVASGYELPAALAATNPDILLLDLAMPGMENAAVFVQSLKQERPDLKVLVLTSYDDEELIFGLMQAGVDGYMLKEEAEDALLHGLRQLANGKRYFNPEVAHAALRLFQTEQATAEPDCPLTARELEVLQLVAEGLSNREIGHTLHISPATARNHVSSILSKLDLRSRTEAVRYALERGLVELRPSRF